MSSLCACFLAWAISARTFGFNRSANRSADMELSELQDTGAIPVNHRHHASSRVVSNGAGLHIRPRNV